MVEDFAIAVIGQANEQPFEPGNGLGADCRGAADKRVHRNSTSLWRAGEEVLSADGFTSASPRFKIGVD